MKLSIHQRILKKTVYTRKIFSSTTVFNIDNKKKCFLSTKSTY